MVLCPSLAVSCLGDIDDLMISAIGIFESSGYFLAYTLPN